MPIVLVFKTCKMSISSNSRYYLLKLFDVLFYSLIINSSISNHFSQHLIVKDIILISKMTTKRTISVKDARI